MALGQIVRAGTCTRGNLSFEALAAATFNSLFLIEAFDKNRFIGLSAHSTRLPRQGKHWCSH